MSEIRFYGDLNGQGPQTYEGEITPDGLLHLPPGVREEHFPTGRAVALLRNDVLWLLPASADDPDALTLRQRTLAGAQTADVRDVYDGDFPVGPVTEVWSDAHRRLEVSEMFA